MIKLYTDEEFDEAKSSFYLNLKCEDCGDIIKKQKRNIIYGIKGYQGKQNDYCKICTYKNKFRHTKIELCCGYCNSKFEGSKTKNDINASINYCSKKCSISHRNILNKNNRAEINKKISEGVKKDLDIKGILIKKGYHCEHCNVNFCTLSKKKNKYCSEECRYIVFRTTEYREKMQNLLKGKAGGLREGGGYSKMLSYTNWLGEEMKLNKEEIEVAKIMDKLKLKWHRNTKGFKYVSLSGKDRKYFPDFYVEEYNCFIEYKGWVTDEMIHKMNDAEYKNDLTLLIIYSTNKRYKDMGLNIGTLKENNDILIDYLKNN
jgi:hypothetical protein